jgi:hypothetical protein
MGKHINKRKQKTTCKNGHEYIEGSYYVRNRNGALSRNCLVCITISNRNKHLIKKIGKHENILFKRSV